MNWKRNTLKNLNSRGKLGPNGCLEWTGPIRKDGYASVSYLGKTSMLHRLAWILTHGEIQPGLMVLHSCDNRKCFNMAHLSLGTSKDNAQDALRRGRNAFANRTWCKNGHEYNKENTYRYPSGRRYCKACGRESKRRAALGREG